MCIRNTYTILLNYFYWKDGAWNEAVVVAMFFCSPFEQTVKKMNFLV
jgi:hypothetical protein